MKSELSDRLLSASRYSLVLFALLFAAAILLSPVDPLHPEDGGYGFFSNSLADLDCTRFQHQPNGFSLACMVASAFAAAVGLCMFFVPLSSAMRKTHWGRRLGSAILIAGVLAAAGLLCAAVTPADIAPQLHGEFSFGCVAALIVATAAALMGVLAEGRTCRRLVTPFSVLNGILIFYLAVLIAGSHRLFAEPEVLATVEKIAVCSTVLILFAASLDL